MSVLPIVTDATFESEVLKSPVPVLVEFANEGCGSCAMLQYTLKEVEEELPGKIKAVKIIAGDNPENVGKYSIFGAPTTLLFVKGEKKADYYGPQQKEELVAKLAEYL